MKRSSLLAVLMSLGLVTAHAPASSAGPRVQPVAAAVVQMAAADCHSIGQDIANREGGQLARATPQNRGGQQVCVIVVLVPGKDGSRPRRQEIVVPAG